MRFCEFCGTALPKQAQFCGRCGNALPELTIQHAGSSSDEADWLLDERPTVRSDSQPRIAPPPQAATPPSTYTPTPPPSPFSFTPLPQTPDQMKTRTAYEPPAPSGYSSLPQGSYIPNTPTELIPGFFEEQAQRER